MEETEKSLGMINEYFKWNNYTKHNTIPCIFDVEKYILIWNGFYVYNYVCEHKERIKITVSSNII